jgi:hypothetical protein
MYETRKIIVVRMIRADDPDYENSWRTCQWALYYSLRSAKLSTNQALPWSRQLCLHSIAISRFLNYHPDNRNPSAKAQFGTRLDPLGFFFIDCYVPHVRYAEKST